MKFHNILPQILSLFYIQEYKNEFIDKIENGFSLLKERVPSTDHNQFLKKQMSIKIQEKWSLLLDSGGKFPDYCKKLD